MISRGVNFPALVLAYPLRNEGQAIFERNGDYTLVWIGVNDLGFFIGIVFFWIWRGKDTGPEMRRSHSVTAAWPTKAKGLLVSLAELYFGVLRREHVDSDGQHVPGVPQSGNRRFRVL